jgi:hypothetical protein
MHGRHHPRQAARRAGELADGVLVRQPRHLGAGDLPAKLMQPSYCAVLAVQEAQLGSDPEPAPDPARSGHCGHCGRPGARFHDRGPHMPDSRTRRPTIKATDPTFGS